MSNPGPNNVGIKRYQDFGNYSRARKALFSFSENFIYIFLQDIDSDPVKALLQEFIINGQDIQIGSKQQYLTGSIWEKNAGIGDGFLAVATFDYQLMRFYMINTGTLEIFFFSEFPNATV